MNTEDECQENLTATLRKIGRNLLNYQLVERLWKTHLNFADVTTVLDNGAIKVKTSEKSRRKIPMGWLAETHRKSLFTPIQDAETEETSSKITIKTSFRIGEDGTLNDSRRKQVVTLVKERNHLVHSLSETFDSTSKESCINLSVKLDEENIRILEELEFLKNISSSYQEYIREIQKYFESDEFINEITKVF